MNDNPLADETDSFRSYHQRNRKICRHPDRPAIEFDYLPWQMPHHIALEHDVPWRSVYRHAHALGLPAQRRRNLRSSVEFILEKSSHPAPTAGEAIRAIQLYARMDDEGRIVEVPKTQMIVISRDGGHPEIAAANPAQNGQDATSNPQLGAPERPFCSQEPGAPLQLRPSWPENTDTDVETLMPAQPSQLDNSKRTESDLTH